MQAKNIEQVILINFTAKLTLYRIEIRICNILGEYYLF